MTCHKPSKMKHVEMHTKTHVAIFFSSLGNADVVLDWHTSSCKSATYTKRAGRRLTPISGQSRTSPRACLDLNPNPMSFPNWDMFVSLFCHVSWESGICKDGLKRCIKQECAQWISGLLGSKHITIPELSFSNLHHLTAAQTVTLFLRFFGDFMIFMWFHIFKDFESLTFSYLFFALPCPVQGSQALLTTSDIAMQILSVRILREPSASERAIMAHPITEPSAWDDTGEARRGLLSLLSLLELSTAHVQHAHVLSE